MENIWNWLTRLDEVPPDFAWELIERVILERTALTAGAVIMIMLGVSGLLTIGSFWFVFGIGYTLLVLAWRLAQTHRYVHARNTATPKQWAARNLCNAWATGAGWGGWATIVAFEPNSALAAVTLGAHAGVVSGSAIRNAPIPGAAIGQNLLASMPLAVSCLASGNVYFKCYALLVVLHTIYGIRISMELRQQTIQLLMREKQTADYAIQLAGANQDLSAMNEHLQKLAGTDALTGVPNRRSFDLAMIREWRCMEREQQPLSLLLLDVDHFKKFNDLHGHLEGDACLRAVASAITAAVRRPGDSLARYGGEEFAVILPQTDMHGARKTAEGILDELKRRRLAHAGSPYGVVTASIGAACGVPGDSSLTDLIRFADEALYAAKRNGRNCVSEAKSRAPKQSVGAQSALHEHVDPLVF